MEKDTHKVRLFMFFIMPALVIYSIFIIYPIFSTGYNSMFNWTGLNDEKEFIGLENYRRLAADTAFSDSFRNNLWVIVASVFLQIPLGLLMAILVEKKSKQNNILRIMYFIPFLMSTVAIGLTWSFLYDPMIGVFNHWIGALGFDTSQLLWLGSKDLALFSVLLVVLWNYAPFSMIIFNAALGTINKDYYEAASIDGATVWQQFKVITLPLLTPTIMNNVVLSLVGSLKSFDLFYIMTQGGPGTSTELMGTYMYKQGFKYFKMGYASAVAFTMFCVSVLTIVFVKWVQKKTAKEANI